MSKVLLAFLVIVLNFTVAAQTKKTFTVNSGQKIVEAIPVNEIYSHPEFTLGTAHEKKLEKWLDENKIDFSKEDDLKRLFNYLQSL